MTKGRISPGTLVHYNFQLDFNWECFIICKRIFVWLHFPLLSHNLFSVTNPQGCEKKPWETEIVLVADWFTWVTPGVISAWMIRGVMVLCWVLRSFWVDWEGRTWAPDVLRVTAAHTLIPQRVGMRGSGGTCQLNWDLTFYTHLGGVELTALCLLAFRFSPSKVSHTQDWLREVTGVSGMLLSCSTPLPGFIPGGFK